jgi:phosphoribosylformylglycinamidine (FGAM) synthase PurS component
MNATRTFAVSLTIPDNEAFTASETLGRLGIPVARVARADIWQFEVDESAGDLAKTIASIEAIHNPNKHRLAERESDRPPHGEVWIAARDERPSALVAGRTIPGVRAVRRRTAWRLLDDDGQAVSPARLDQAVETFLCNPAFQMAIRESAHTGVEAP